MDISTIIGLVVGIVLLIASILMSGRLALFISMTSLLIVIGGSFTSLLIGYPGKKFMTGLKTIKYAFTQVEINVKETIMQINELALVARKEGLLALEELAIEMEQPFLKKGILLVVDGTEPELVRSILETEITFLEARHKENQAFWNSLAEYTPAWGMIGTLIGLIAMLDSLSDPTTIGPKMAVALITTLYGTLAANFFATPIANKLKIRSQEEILLKEIMVEGLLDIQAGENPQVIEEKLKAFLSPEIRMGFETEKND